MVDKSPPPAQTALDLLMAAVPGVPGEDYPILSTSSLGQMSHTTGFSCQHRNIGGTILTLANLIRIPSSPCRIFCRRRSRVPLSDVPRLCRLLTSGLLLLPLPQRDPVPPGALHLRLVVQRGLRALLRQDRHHLQRPLPGQ